MANKTRRDDVAGVQHELVDLGNGKHAEVVQTISGGSVASDGSIINIDSLPKTLAYNADGTLNYTQVTDGTSVWRQTLTYTSGRVSAISEWVKQ